MKKFQFALVLAACALFTVSSCLKKDYDAPPDLTGYDPALPVNLTIAQLKAKMTGTTAKLIDSNWTVYGIVNADDRSGNFYKQINIEDSTGGITILIDNYNLYTKYPVGRKVYVNLKGLYYGYYSKLPQLGGAVDNAGGLSGIPATSVDNFIVRANFPNEVPVHKFTGLASLKAVNLNMVNRLVQIDSVEIEATDTADTYAQVPSIASGTSINIEDCSGNKIVMRTSGYANFQAHKVPKGKGSIVALYTVFNTTPQLVIRDTNDLKFYGGRCSGGSTNPGTPFFLETFNSATSGAINLTGWTNYVEAGNQKWSFSNAGSTSNPYAKVTAFSTGQASVISWLITPQINLAGKNNPILSFKNTDGFDNGATLKVFISTNYNGTNPTAATWTQLNANISTGHTSGYGPFISSGNISLSAYTGNVHIAFKYEGADPAGTKKTTTYEIDEVTVSAN